MKQHFRVNGKVPELWHPETGKDRTCCHTALQMVSPKVKLPLEPNDAVFVVFKDKAVKTSVTLPPVKEKQLVTVEGSWNVSFQKDRGAPASSNI